MVSYIPVLTTLFSVFFLSRIVPHYLAKRSPYLLWWTLGVLTFGLGTLTESINAIFGWSEWNTKVWYIVGALLGGYPLAQGTIYLLMNKRFADISAAGVLGGHRRCRRLRIVSRRLKFRRASITASPGECLRGNGSGHFLPCSTSTPSSSCLAVPSTRPSSISRRTRRARVSSATFSLPLARCSPASAEASPASATWRSCTSRNSSDLSFIYFGYHMMRKDRSASLHANQQTWEGSTFTESDPRAT